MTIRTGRMLFGFSAFCLVLMAFVGLARAQTADNPLTIDDPQFEPMPIAIAPFLSDPSLAGRADEIADVMRANLERSGFFRIVPPEAHIARVTEFDTVPDFDNWTVLNVQALVTGTVGLATDGRLVVQFRVFDVLAGEAMEGRQILGDPRDWRRVAHKVTDGVYTTLTGEGPYFDSRVVFVAESGSKGDRRKRLAIMDQDGANVRTLPDASGLVLAPRFSPSQQAILYISYNTGEPRVYLLNLDTNQREALGDFPGMTFAPRFSPSGREVILSLAQEGNTDLYAINLATRQRRRLTRDPGIETSPDYSPDGSQIVFESDRGGKPQLYVMPSSGGTARRISFGGGSYGTPVWSPRGDLIAFTKLLGGQFYVGVMRTDGSDERLLVSGFHVEGPTFSPNGRVVMFFEEGAGARGTSRLRSVDISGRSLQTVQGPGAGSDPAWGPLRDAPVQN